MRRKSGILLKTVHLKVHRRKKDGKEHRYFSMVPDQPPPRIVLEPESFPAGMLRL
jgi:hypothetical protein